MEIDVVAVKLHPWPIAQPIHRINHSVDADAPAPNTCVRNMKKAMTGMVNMATVKRKSLRPTSWFWGSISLRLAARVDWGGIVRFDW